jgi:hypothetical protein
LSIFVEKISNFSFFSKALLQIHLGSGAARIRNGILLNVSGPTGSASTTLAGTPGKSIVVTIWKLKEIEG